MNAKELGNRAKGNTLNYNRNRQEFLLIIIFGLLDDGRQTNQEKRGALR